MRVGELVHLIRESKNIPAINVYNSVMSKNMFYKFEKGNFDTTSEKFMKIMSRLNISLKEFEFLLSEKKCLEYDTEFLKLTNAFYSKDISALQQIHNETKLMYQRTLEIRFNHLSALSQIYYDMCSHNTTDQTNTNIIRNYLLNVENWTYYEWTLFNNSLSIFNIEDVQFLINKSLQSLSIYETHNNFGNENILVLGNIAAMYIKSYNFEKIPSLVNRMETIHLSEIAVFERLIFSFFEGVSLYVLGTDTSLKKSLDVIKVMDNMHLVHLSKDHQELLNIVQKNIV
ncbi:MULTISPECIES: hypothetical protein [Latilactobacillus]|uniref:Putative Rgg-type transcriptional regulator n=1 Tax=Latilactobacillus sakei TaxID=1599 RepID=Q9AEC7_LATSK|nr:MULTISPECIES: hypothetical protein [Latilactobacillus]ASN13554.1 hypothetical protein B4V05_09975 [Latilactobacillus sakei]MCM1636302.1 hypothetical protein [Latilactobacillus sakei]MCW8780670.1 hypothetical protein [Latilactobacillus curvatus]USF99096.1 hypothetical protein A4W81_09650 [Latilactobacillus sakei]UTB73242.1 hypothetical protein A4W72_10815 [Latilactobacillus curvatus]